LIWQSVPDVLYGGQNGSEIFLVLVAPSLAKEVKATQVVHWVQSLAQAITAQDEA
jgi:hypothetical protein